MVRKRLAPLLPAVHQHLGVTMRAEAVARLFKGPAKRLEVVDLPVEDDLDRAVLVAHGLITGLQVDDLEAGVAQSADS